MYIIKEHIDPLVNLLIISEGTTITDYYCLLHCFMGPKQSTQSHKVRPTSALQGIVLQERMLATFKQFRQHDSQNVVMPSVKNKWLEFNDFGKMIQVPFTIYADIECILQYTSANKMSTNILTTLMPQFHLLKNMKQKRMS